MSSMLPAQHCHAALCIRTAGNYHCFSQTELADAGMWAALLPVKREALHMAPTSRNCVFLCAQIVRGAIEGDQQVPTSKIPDQASVQQPQTAPEDAATTLMMPARALQASGTPFAISPSANALAPAPEKAAMGVAPALAPQTIADVASVRSASAAFSGVATSMQAVADALAANQVCQLCLNMTVCPSVSHPAEWDVCLDSCMRYHSADHDNSCMPMMLAGNATGEKRV